MENEEEYANDVTGTPIYNELKNPTPKKWYKKILTKKFRKWAYGVSIAAVTVASVATGNPEFIAVVAPLVMAIFYVDETGEAK